MARNKFSGRTIVTVVTIVVVGDTDDMVLVGDTKRASGKGKKERERERVQKDKERQKEKER